MQMFTGGLKELNYYCDSNVIKETVLLSQVLDGIIIGSLATHQYMNVSCRKTHQTVTSQPKSLLYMSADSPYLNKLLQTTIKLRFRPFYVNTSILVWWRAYCKLRESIRMSGHCCIKSCMKWGFYRFMF